MTCSSSVGLIIRCNITPRHSSKVSSEDKLLSFWCRGGVPRVPRAVATPLNIRCSNIASATVCNFVSKWRSVFRMQMSFAVQRTCQPLKPYRRMTSSRWRAVLRTAATGRQSWDGSTQLHVITLPMTTPPWQPMTRRLLHSWCLVHLLVYRALRSFVLSTLLSHQHLWWPMPLTCRVTRTCGRHRHSELRL